MKKHSLSLSRNAFLVWVLLLGALVTAYRAKGCVPYYPQDLASYLGGYYAALDGSNPYDVRQAWQSLEKRGILVTPFLFVYPPPFLLAMTPLEIMPYRLFRLSWIAASVLAAWFSVFLLSRGTDRQRPLFMAGAFVFLTISEPLHDNLLCGQVTSFMLLAMALMVYRGFKGAVVGAAATFLLLLKVGFMPLVLFLKGRRALLSAVILLFSLSLSSVLLAGSHSFHQWLLSLGRVNESWGFIHGNNVSVTHAVSLFGETALVRGDIERAVQEDEYRLRIAERQRSVFQWIYLCITTVTLIIIIHRWYKRCYNGVGCSWGNIFSQTILFLLVFIPFVWIHYGLFFLIPFRQLLLKGRSVPAILFILGAMVWGLPLALVPAWTKFLIPMIWLFSTAF